MRGVKSENESSIRMRFTRRLRGGSNWDNVPPERLPSPTFWNKCIPGTPHARVQAEVAYYFKEVTFYKVFSFMQKASTSPGSVLPTGVTIMP